MSIAATKMLLAMASAYGVVGLLIAAAFLLVGLDRVAPAARGAYAFRPLLVPGLVLLWPLVVARWAALTRTGVQSVLRRQKSAHALIWSVLAVVLPAILAVAWAQRQSALPTPSSVRIAPPAGSAP